MDNHTGQTPFTDEELAQALRLGTDAAARRQGALRAGVLARVHNPKRRRPLWQTLAACAAAAVLLVAAAWALAHRLPQWDVVQPLGTRAPRLPSVTLSTNIQRYSPVMSSAQGITLTAWDSSGNPLTGSWKASWGVFLGSVSEQGNLIPRSGDYTDTLQHSARALWSFAPDAGDIPLDITVTFTSPDGLAATLHMVQDGEITGFVRVVNPSSSIRFRGRGFCINVNPSLGGQVEPLVVEAVDGNGNPVNGSWSVSFGTIHSESGTLDNGSKVSWIFAAKTADEVPDRAQLFFSAADGRAQVLELTKGDDNPFALAMTAQQAGEFLRDMYDDAEQAGSALRLRTDKSGVNADPSRNAVTFPILLKAEGDTTGPVRGTWTASFGLLSAQGRSFSGDTVTDADTVSWSFAASAAGDIPDTAEITFTAPDGRTKTLHLKKYPDHPWSLVIVPEELDYYPLEPAVTQPVATATPAARDEMPALGADDLNTMELTLLEKDQTIPLTPEQKQAFLEAYQSDSTPGDDSIGTTPTFAVKLTLSSGTLRIWGPELITWGMDSGGQRVQHNINNDKLHQWFTNLRDSLFPPATTNQAGLPLWKLNMPYEGSNWDLLWDADHSNYPAEPTQWKEQTTWFGTLRLPERWTISTDGSDGKLIDQAGEKRGTLELTWLDPSRGDAIYSGLLPNHVENAILQTIESADWMAYKVILELDNGTAANGIGGVLIEHKIIYIPGTVEQRDGKPCYPAYVLTLYKARTGASAARWLSSATIDTIALSWQPPQPVGNE